MIDYTPDLDLTQPGPVAIRGMPNEKYRAAPGMSQSDLKPFLRSIRHGAYALANKRKETPAMHFGTAMHTLMLDGVTEFHRKYAVGGPVNPSTEKTYGRDTKAFADWLKEQGGKEFVSPEEMERMIAMRDEIRKSFAGDVLETPGVLRELSMFWDEPCGETTVRCKARLDWFHADIGIVDLKTCADSSAQEFGKDIGNRGMHIQAAAYRLAAKRCGLSESCAYGWIAVESAAPHAIELHRPEDWMFTCGLTAFLKAVHRYAAWRDGDIEQPTAFREIKLPSWAWEPEKDIETYLGEHQ